MPDFSKVVPGDFLRLKMNQVVCWKVVVAIVKNNAFLFDDGSVASFQEITDLFVGEEYEPFDVSSDLYSTLLSLGLGINSFDDLKVGDAIIMFNGLWATTAVIAVIDRPRKVAYDKNGKMILLGERKMAFTGWHTEQKDLLTEAGRQEMNSLYP